MTQAAALAQYGSTGVSQGFKNRIINGAMVIDQRNAGASISGTGGGKYATDRWRLDLDSSPTITIQQSSSVYPTNFSFSWFANITGAGTVSAGHSNTLLQKIEGFNTADLNFGTANAQTITVSFWVRSSVAGTYGLGIANSASNWSYPAQYTVNSANTWEYKTITITGATSGTWIGATNGIGVNVLFDMGSGSGYEGTANTWQAGLKTRVSGNVNLCTQSSATFYITGVQLEVGSTATSFDYRPYGTELALCQRYYYKLANSPSEDPTNKLQWMFAVTSALTSGRATINFKVSMRTAPTCTAAFALSNMTAVTSNVGIQFINTETASPYANSTTEAILLSSFTASAEL